MKGRVFVLMDSVGGVMVHSNMGAACLKEEGGTYIFYLNISNMLYIPI